MWGNPEGGTMGQKVRVGIIGASPERGWAFNAHLPALAAMDAFEIAAVATTRKETAEASAARFGADRAYDDWRRLVEDPAVDVVAVCVKVAHHHEMVLGAVAAGKHVFCEWPLGLDAAEAEEMRAAAASRGVLNLVGLQGRASPPLNAVRDLVREGAIGEVISASLVSSLSNWGPRLPAAEAYRTEKSSGATGLTVPGGHSLDCLCYCLGEFSEVSAVVTTQHPLCEIVGTGEVLPVTAPDQVLIAGRLTGGAVVSVHVKADIANPTGVLFEVNGTNGDILVRTKEPVGLAPVGIQRADLTVEVSRGRKKPFVAVEDFAAYRQAPDGVPDGPPFYTAQLYARLAASLATGAPLEPDFSAAVGLHRLLEAVEAASDTGQRQTLVA